MAKDHMKSIRGDISVRTIALDNTSKQFTVKVFSAKTTTPTNHPCISVKVPPEYKVNFSIFFYTKIGKNFK